MHEILFIICTSLLLCARFLTAVKTKTKQKKLDIPLKQVFKNNCVYLFILKGNVGAATTVEVSRDGKSGQMYPGFPYVVWTDKDGSRHSEIRVVGRLSQ